MSAASFARSFLNLLLVNFFGNKKNKQLIAMFLSEFERGCVYREE